MLFGRVGVQVCRCVQMGDCGVQHKGRKRRGERIRLRRRVASLTSLVSWTSIGCSTSFHLLVLLRGQYLTRCHDVRNKCTKAVRTLEEPTLTLSTNTALIAGTTIWDACQAPSCVRERET